MSLPDELHFEILKYLPPHPKVLIRASAVCREWRFILRDPVFHRLHRALHGEPSATAALGFFHNAASGVQRRFLQISRPDDPAKLSLPSSNGRGWKFVDQRHGRILLSDGGFCPRFLLWLPMTGERHVIPAIDLFLPSEAGSNRRNSAGLICLCNNDHGEGRHVACHTSPFRVAVVFCLLGRKNAAVYSSLTGIWSDDIWPTRMPETSGLRTEPCAVVGNTMYQPLHDNLVLACDTEEERLITFERPKGSHARLLRADGDVLGLAMVRALTLHLWTLDADANWVLRNRIDMVKVLPGLSTAQLPRTDYRFALMPPVKVIGVAEDGDVLFLWTMLGIFMFSPKSKDLKKVHEAAANMEIVYPFSASYLPLTWNHYHYLSDGRDRKRRRTTNG